MRRFPATFLILLAVGGTLGFVAGMALVPPSPVPVDPHSLTVGWSDERRCGECHEQAHTFWQTGHARTLRRATEESSRTLLAQLHARRPELENLLRISQQSQSMRVDDLGSQTPRSLELDWCFGSGAHACTWVGTLEDSWGATDLVEFRWTWYAQQQTFDRTPGQPATPDGGYFGQLGVLFDAPKARRCFSCHATQLPDDAGRIDEAAIHPGVTCQRCHGPQASHVQSDGQIISRSLTGMNQAEAIAHCAQCHRSAEDRDVHDISPENPEIVRFQPIGLVRSRCFQESPTLTCTTCHDPHRPMSSQDSAGSWQCRTCHEPGEPQHTQCRAGHSDGCVACHMPKVRGAAPVAFTDHWIRVQRAKELDTP